MRFRSLVLFFLFVLSLALAQTSGGGTSPIDSLGSSIGSAVDAVNNTVVPKILTLLGTLISVSLGWAIVRVIRGG